MFTQPPPAPTVTKRLVGNLDIMMYYATAAHAHASRPRRVPRFYAPLACNERVALRRLRPSVFRPFACSLSHAAGTGRMSRTGRPRANASARHHARAGMLARSQGVRSARAERRWLRCGQIYVVPFRCASPFPFPLHLPFYFIRF